MFAIFSCDCFILVLTPWLTLYVPGMCHMYLRDWDAAKESLDQALALNRHQQTYTVLGR